jgi:hypothetical protein
MMARRRGPLVATVAVLAIAYAVYAVIAWWSPIVGGDWDHELWAARHAHAGTAVWLRDFVAQHWRLGRVLGYVLVRARVVHALVTPLASLAMIVGMFAIARRRLPRASSWDDLAALALLSAFFWIAQPHAGLVMFYRPYVAAHVYGATLALWFVAPFVCRWSVSRTGAVILAVAGLLVGTGTPQLAVPVAIGCAVIVWRMPGEARPRWMAVALAAECAAAAVSLALPPYLDVHRVLGRSVATNLDYLGMPVRECGELTAVVAALVLGSVLLAKLSPLRKGFTPDDDDLVELARTLPLAAIWLALVVFALFGPFYSEATLVPATLVLCIAAVPFARVVARDPWMRAIVLAIAIGVHGVVWAHALATYHRAGAEFRDRIDRLAHATPGTVAIVPPYSQIYPDFYFFGEDMALAADREQLATEIYGLHDFDISPPFRGLERNPDVHLALDADASAPDAPVRWPRDLVNARHRFKELVRRMRATAPHASARLLVTDLSFPELAGRPLLAAWADDSGVVAEDPSRLGPDYEDRYTSVVSPALAARFDEAWIVLDGKATRVTCEHGSVRWQPMTTGRWATVLCNSRQCLLVDAFIPRF